MKIIPLTQGLETIVDDSDYEWLSQFNWCAVRLGRRKTPYAARGVQKRLLFMHKVIMSASGRTLVDHKNGITLDNQRNNLRPCSSQQNSFNRKVTTKHGGVPTLFKGVCWHKRRHKWQANICKNRTKIHIGYYDLEQDAALAYNAKALELFGEFASPNHVAAPVEKRIKSPLDL